MFDVRKESTWAQYVTLLCICLFPCGAYFVYDAPAALQRYFMPALNIDSTGYMSYYTWYSAPNIVMCIAGGIIVDNVLGRRLGAIVFCGTVFLGQLFFAFGIKNQYEYIAKFGRTITGVGVESIAVTSKCFLTWWYTGTPLYSAAFGICIAFWRVSSSASLMTMVPYYNGMNEITPQDGIIEQFTTCKKCSEFYNDPKGNENTTDVIVFPYPEAEGIEYENDRTYYCYDRNTLDTCDMLTVESINDWNNGEKIKACSKFDDTTQAFVEKAGIEKYQCFDHTTFEFESDNCNCLDDEYLPEDKWKWADDLHSTYSDKISDEWTEDVLAPLRDPWYWIDFFGDYCHGEDFETRQRYFNELKSYSCEAEHEIPHDFERFVKTEDDRWSVQTFVNTLDRPALYSYKECTQKAAYLYQIPEADNEVRLNSISSVYYMMLVVTLFATGVATFLFFFDQKAEATFYKENPDVKPEVKPPVTPASLLDGAKRLPLPVWVIYIAVICFYVPVFIFIPHAPKLFEDHLGMPVALATKATGVLYLLAVPFTPGIGALVAYTGNHLIFLCGAYMLAALGHLVFLSLRGFLAGLFGMTLLSLGYGIIGCCLWPCIGALVDKDLTGKAYGLAYAIQQLGLTGATMATGFIKDKMGYVALECFFILICALGLLCALYLFKTLGRNLPSHEEKKEDDKPETEAVPLKQAEANE